MQWREWMLVYTEYIPHKLLILLFKGFKKSEPYHVLHFKLAKDNIVIFFLWNGVKKYETFNEPPQEKHVIVSISLPPFLLSSPPPSWFRTLWPLQSLLVFPLQSLPPIPARFIVTKFQSLHDIHLHSFQCLLKACKTQLKHLNFTLRVQLTGSSIPVQPSFGPGKLGIHYGTFTDTLLPSMPFLLSFFMPYPFFKVFSQFPPWSLQPIGVSRHAFFQ